MYYSWFSYFICFLFSEKMLILLEYDISNEIKSISFLALSLFIVFRFNRILIILYKLLYFLNIYCIYFKLVHNLFINYPNHILYYEIFLISITLKILFRQPINHFLLFTNLWKCFYIQSGIYFLLFSDIQATSILKNRSNHQDVI